MMNSLNETNRPQSFTLRYKVNAMKRMNRSSRREEAQTVGEEPELGESVRASLRRLLPMHQSTLHPIAS